MKEITKDNKGITLVALIITIILMLILTSVTTYTGINTYKNAQVTKFVTQMQLVQGKVDELKESKTIEELNSMGIGISEAINEVPIISTVMYKAQDNGEIVINDDYTAYRFFSSEDIKQQLDLEEGIDGEIMINFTTREVISTTGVEYKDKIYYTQYQLPNGQKLINNTSQTDRDLRFDLNIEVDGLNATVKIKGIQIANATLSYREQGNSFWTNITNYTEKGKEYSILLSKTSTYEFKIKDNTTGQENAVIQKLVLTNKPKTDAQINSYNYSLTSENWAYATDINENNYVWIPRFAYKIDEETNTTEIKFIKGNSNITTDDFVINEEWKIHEKLNLEDGTKLTGIWVKADNLKQAGLDLITLLDNSTEETMLTEIKISDEQ